MTPPKKNDISPSSPSFSHNVMDQISNSFSSRRPSGNNFARFAFNIYGGNNPNVNNVNNANTSTSPGVNTGSSSYGSNPYAPLGTSTSSSSTSSYTRPTSSSHAVQHYNTSEYSHQDNSLKFISNNEILSFDHSKSNPSMIAIGGQRLLQVLRIQEDAKEIVIENDLNHTVQTNRGNKTGTISDLKFGHSQFSNFIAAAATSGNIYLYNVIKSNKVVATLNDHSRTVNTLDVSPIPAQTHCLLSGSQDGTIKLWDLRAKGTKPVLTIHGAADPVRSVQFSPHLVRKMAAIFDSGVIKKYDLRNPNQAERKMNAHTGPGLSIDWHPEFDYIVSGGRDKQIQVWNMSSSNNESRVPDYVINAAGPLAKVKWCPQTNLSNMSEAKLASCLFGDDPVVQIWNLNRRYVPEYNVESHYNQVTSLLWKNTEVLWTSSKDKTLIQHDIGMYPRFVDNLATAALDWSNTSNEMILVSQRNEDFMTKWIGTTQGAPLPTHSSEVNLPSCGSSASSNTNSMVPPSGLSFTQLNTPANPPSPMERPNMSRSMTHRPQLIKNLSNHQQQQLHQLQAHLQASPFLCPVELPLLDDQETFEFLAGHYLTMVPEGMDFISVCEYNAMIAANARRFRDSQTWRVLKASITWFYEQGGAFTDKERVERLKKEENADGNHKIDHSVRSFTNSRTNSELDIGSLGSHSTGTGGLFGSSPNVGMLAAGLKTTSLTPTPPPPQHASEANSRSQNSAIEQHSAADPSEAQLSADNEPTAGEGDLKEGHTDEGKIPESQPIEIRSPSRKRQSFNGLPDETVPYAFTGSIPDYDDEMKGYQSSSAGKSSVSLQSSLSSHRHDSFSNNTWKHMITTTKMTALPKANRSESQPRSIRSGKSVLSKVLREHQLSHQNNEEAITDGEDDDVEEDTEGDEDTNLAVPWAPALLTKEAAEYSASQGNVIMCATLALLFAHHFEFRYISRYQAMDWIYTFHDLLCRRKLFTIAADVLKTASRYYPVLRQKGQTETSLRFFCCKCDKLILNEQSKMKEGDVDFGYWYCDSCSKIVGNCCYCNELMKGMTVATLPCGHMAHFGCYRSWFFTEAQRCCPACAYPVL